MTPSSSTACRGVTSRYAVPRTPLFLHSLQQQWRPSNLPAQRCSRTCCSASSALTPRVAPLNCPWDPPAGPGVLPPVRDVLPHWRPHGPRHHHVRWRPLDRCPRKGAEHLGWAHIDGLRSHDEGVESPTLCLGCVHSFQRQAKHHCNCTAFLTLVFYRWP